MSALFFILGSVMLFMFVYIASKDGLGPAHPLLSTAYVGLWLYCMFEAIMMWKTGRRSKRSNNQIQRDYSRMISGRRYREPTYEEELEQLRRRP